MPPSPEASRWAYPLVAVAAATIGGDALAPAAGAAGVAPAVAAAAALAGVVPFLCRRGDRARGGAVALLAFAVALARADAVYRPWVAPDDVAALDLPAHVAVAAEVVAEPEVRPGGLRLVLRVERLGSGAAARPAQGTILLSIRNPGREWARGDRLAGTLRLRRPRNFGNPGEFDYERHLARRGIGVSGFAWDDTALARSAGAGAAPFTRWRAGVAQVFDAHAAPTEAALLKALVVGRSADLPQAVRDSFAQAGVSHILSISGLHIGLVAAVGYGVFRWLLARSEWLLLHLVVPRLATALALVPVLLYAGIAGTNVATVRSVAMAALVLGAVLGGRQANLPVILALAALGIVAADPGVTAEIGFQLSFAAVAGLLVATQRLERWWRARAEDPMRQLRPWRERVLRAAAAFAAVSVAALLATAPLVAWHFNFVSLAAPLANLVVNPVLGTLVVPLGLLAALLQPLAPEAAGWVTALAAPLVRLGVWLVGQIAALPFASVRVTTPSVLQLGFFYAAAIALAFAARLPPRFALAAWAGVLAVAVAPGAWPRGGDGGMRVTFLSVGQGDAAVVELPDGKVMLVDGGGLAGGGFDVGERLLAPFLWSRGIDRVDVLVVTHPQWDHYGGLGFVAAEFAPAEVWTGGAQGAGAGWERFAATLARSGARAVVVQRGDERRFGDARVRVLGPPPQAALGVNDASVVLALERAGRRILLAGDVEAAGERALLAQGAALLRSDVLKVPHHGSATSSSAPFVAAVAPALAVVSAGRDNRFGFPRREVANRYRAAAARLLRTDRAGAVSVAVDARGRLAVDTFRSGEAVIDSL